MSSAGRSRCSSSRASRSRRSRNGAARSSPTSAIIITVAWREGIRFSAEADHDIRTPISPVRFIPRPRLSVVYQAVAAVLLFGIALPAAYYYGRGSVRQAPVAQNAPASNVNVSALEHRIDELTATNSDLTAQLVMLQDRLQRIT